MSYLHHVSPPVLWLDHVHPSSSQTVSRATLQFPDCITCSPPVPWLYHMLPSSSQTVSRATLEFTKCIMPSGAEAGGGGGWGVYIPPNNWTPPPPPPPPPNNYKMHPPNILNLLNGDHLVLRTWPSRPKLLNYQLVLKKWQSRPKKNTISSQFYGNTNSS